MRMLVIGVALCVLAAPASAKEKLACFEEPGTRATTCIDENAVTMNGDTRASPVYTGGPKGVRKTSYLFVTNCAKGVTTLQDRDGVNFAGGFSSSTKAARALSQWACEVKKPRKDTKLRQF